MQWTIVVAVAAAISVAMREATKESRSPMMSWLESWDFPARGRRLTLTSSSELSAITPSSSLSPLRYDVLTNGTRDGWNVYDADHEVARYGAKQEASLDGRKQGNDGRTTIGRTRGGRGLGG